MRSWREGQIGLDEGVVDALDTCLGCRACETACPSGVAYGEILEEARAQVEKQHLRPKTEEFARTQFLKMLTTPSLMAAALKAGGIMGKLTQIDPCAHKGNEGGQPHIQPALFGGQIVPHFMH